MSYALASALAGATARAEAAKDMPALMQTMGKELYLKVS
jgi:hypothetical protein